MKGLVPLFLGLFGTFAFSWVGLTMIPNAQIGRLDPQMDEEGTDIYPAPKSGMADRGRRIYAANGCVYCHSQQVRPAYAASDIDRKWGERRSAPRDYIFDRPAMLGKMRMGPDLANIGKRAPVDDENAPPPASTGAPAPAAPGAAPAPATGASPAPSAAPAPATGSPAAPNPPAAVAAVPAGSPPAATAPPAPAPPSPAPATSAPTALAPPAPTTDVGTGTSQDQPLPYSAAWHHRHLYNPRSMTLDSTMPSYRFLYEKRRVSGQASADALKLSGSSTPPEGWEIVPTYEAKCLVAYLMSLDQSHPLKEVKSTAPASPPAPGTAVK